MNEEFDESILDDEKEFKKRFRRIERPAFLDKIVKNREAKNRITIYLDSDIIEYFKAQAETSRTGYQTLINQALREKIQSSQANKSNEIIERLLQDKNALRRLKAELEAI
jgi:uncharacterized protein (DUF4415 family)